MKENSNKKSNGGIVNNFYGNINTYYENHGTINNYGSQHMMRNDAQEGADNSILPALPDVLSTEEAMAVWEKVKMAGYVNDNYQPLISRTQSALLADAIAERLGIREKWKVFEALWNRKNMYRDYYKALNLLQSLDFQDEIKRLLR
jgi:hypothetical protein